MKFAIHLLRERLGAGWSPKADEIDADIEQVDALNWVWSDGGRRIAFQTIDRDHRLSPEVIYADSHLTYALTSEAFLWLYDVEESEKVRYLGG